MSTVLIKQIADDYADSTGLAKYSRSRMPRTKDIYQAYYNEGTNSYVTGLTDEQAENYSIDGRDYRKASNFWSEFRVTIDSDAPKMFNTANILDNIALKMLIANNYIAPDKDSVNEPKYREAQYYAYTEETENREELTNRKKRDKALAKLLSIENNKEKMLLYGQYLEGIKYSSKFSEDTLYEMLRAYVENKEINNANNFLAVFTKSAEELQHKIITDSALKQRLIKRVPVGNKKYAYQFGQVSLGTTLEEVYKNLASPDFAPELLTIKSELEHVTNRSI